ncbi:MAG: glycosyl hydrolase 115 family protein [Spirochaetales bacterium]|nr:glycosyl hydrolase 115 family protein [Spirochaetales bacterium]
MKAPMSTSCVSYNWEKGCFPLFDSGKSAPLYTDTSDFGIYRAMQHLQADILRVTGVKPKLFTGNNLLSNNMVIAGMLGKSPLVDRLEQEKKIDTGDIAGRRETFLLQAVEKPFPGVDMALIIAGSDKRGTIYGIYDLAACIGVSPWYWWADVPVQTRTALFILPGRHTLGEPAVRYRGFFINDEAPALTRWAYEKYEGFNHIFYEKVFELLLRLKANFLWPAMWGKAFYDDNPYSPTLANKYGIVIGTSHHEPMMCAHEEWKRYGKGPWNYEKNEAALKEFWTRGIKRMGNYESIVTVGMRGDGDEPMTKKANISLLEKIIADQREILSRITRKDPREIPQIWALYKEVQEYYDKGMRVPEDITLMLCDDNWGNIRKLPARKEMKRDGGYGIYYHFDYVGDPRNYKWLNTSPIPRVWEQMHLAFEYGVDRIWIVNVGDIKPMEFPTQFFLDYAWNPAQWQLDRLSSYTEMWVEQQFGPEHAASIAGIIASYTKYNGRRKPELLSPDTYSLIHYREAETIVAEYNKLASLAEQIYKALPPEYRDAYYQLVLHPVLACANLNELYVTAGKNHLYARQGRAATNDLADRVKELFERDEEYTHYYNKVMAGGKWNHMMDQIHIGYTYWQQPDKSAMPEVKKLTIPDLPEMGVAIEGSDSWWPFEKSEAVLPGFDCFKRQSRYIEIFNRGQSSFTCNIQSGEPWVLINPVRGTVEKEKRVWLHVDWERAPKGTHRVPITITGPGMNITVHAVIFNPEFPERDKMLNFVEGDGFVSMEAEHYTRAVNKKPVEWKCIPDLGRTLSAMTPFPVTASSQAPGGDSPRLEYHIHLFTAGEIKVRVYLSPTLDFFDTGGLRYAISFDEDSPQIVNVHTNFSRKAWRKAVSDNIIQKVSLHIIHSPGNHVLKFWMVDAGVVLQKLVVETGRVMPCYLGPTESFYRTVR